MEITYLKGVGPKKAELYKKLGIETVEQLTELYPRDYVDFTDVTAIRDVVLGEFCALRAVVAQKTEPFSRYARVALYKAELNDDTGSITAVFFNAKYTFDKLELGKEYIFYGKITGDLARMQISSPMYVGAHEQGLLPKYHLTAGLSNNMVSANIKTALSAVKREETLSAEILEKFGLLGVQEAMYKIHFPKIGRAHV